MLLQILVEFSIFTCEKFLTGKQAMQSEAGGKPCCTVTIQPLLLGKNGCREATQELGPLRKELTFPKWDVSANTFFLISTGWSVQKD